MQIPFERRLRRVEWTTVALFSTLMAGSALAAPADMHASALADAHASLPVDPHVSAPADPAKVLSNDACVKCHAPEIDTWRRTPHARTFEELHRTPEAKQIASKLGVRSIKYDNRCVGCHYTQQIDHGQPLAIAGVSCESCHGAAKDWVDIHHDYGPDATRETESPEHRTQRLAASIAAGMRNPTNVFHVAQSCYRCHTVQDEELVNVGGHSLGSLDFELVRWSQGTVRHNFLRTGGDINGENSRERLRVMFVAGMMADLEASLRATAKATGTSPYGVNAARRAARAAARLRSVAAKIDNDHVAQAVEAFGAVELRVGNGDRLTDAADRVAELGFHFAAETDGSTLGALDPFIPSSDDWK